MKSFTFLAISILISALGQTSSGSIVDFLRDGFDSVYKFSMKVKASQVLRGQTIPMQYEVHLRKSSQGDDKFVMHITSAKALDRNLIQRLPSIAYPVVFTMNENKALDQSYALEGETENSMKIKMGVIVLMFQNLTDTILKDADKIGNCEIPTTQVETLDQYGVEINVKHDTCYGKLLIVKRPTGDARDMDVETKYYFDKTTNQLMRSYMKSSVKVVKNDPSHTESTIITTADFYFDGYRIIEEDFDETLNTVVHEKPDYINLLFQQ